MNTPKKPASKRNMKKRFGFLRFIRRIAMLTFSRSFGQKPAAIAAEKRMLTNLVGAMRPLMHSIDAATPTITGENQEIMDEQQRHHHLYLLPPPPLPPRRGEDVEEEEEDDDDMLSLEPESRYASADNLLALDDSEDANPEEQNAINEKAEEFIANFYHQIRLQTATPLIVTE